jgi:tryptophan synthase alpha chain
VPTVGDALRRARREGRTALVPYLLVDRARSRRIASTVESFRDAGATALELGFPFSDPIADGPVLEAAHDRALRHGTRWSDLLRAASTASARLPTAVMTYANPLWHRRLDRSFRELTGVGVSAVIVPDLSLEESPGFASAARRAGIDLVLLGAPGLPTARLSAIARRSRGFLYLVARYGTTGAGSPTPNIDLAAMVRTARSAAPSGPILIGFGVRDRSSAERALASGADGVIVGSAVEERLDRGDSAVALTRWLSSIAVARAR